MDVEISPQLIAMFKSSDEPWGVKIIKDNCSFHLYGNKANSELLNLPVRFNIEGRSDKEIPHPISSYTQRTVENRLQMMYQKINVNSVSINTLIQVSP